MKGYAISTWVCPDCPEEVTVNNVTFQDIQEMGVPICNLCGEDMTYEKEVWIQDKSDMN